MNTESKESVRFVAIAGRLGKQWQAKVVKIEDNKPEELCSQPFLDRREAFVAAHLAASALVAAHVTGEVITFCGEKGQERPSVRTFFEDGRIKDQLLLPRAESYTELARRSQ